MNRLTSHNTETRPKDFQAETAISCTSIRSAQNRVEESVQERTRADLIRKLAATESTQIAQHSLGMLTATGFIGIFTLVGGPSPLLLGIWLFVVLTSAMMLRRPWRDQRPRRRECLELLEAIRDSDLTEPLTPYALQVLSALSQPLSGETRESRRLAASLLHRFKKSGIQSLPIAAERANTRAMDLPITTGTLESQT